MPLLMCPNCQSGMQSLTRSSVEFDMCPSCRGVWLDRGELEKIVESARCDTVIHDGALNAPRPLPPQREYGERGENGERGEYEERGYGARGRRNRGLGIFDIFD